jgi:hypothetical protein
MYHNHGRRRAKGSLLEIGLANWAVPEIPSATHVHEDEAQKEIASGGTT